MTARQGMVGGAEPLAEALGAIVGKRNVIADADSKIPYERDVTGRYAGDARLVVLPRDGGECAQTLAICARFGAPVVPQGGNTGLVGGGIPQRGEVVLSTRRMSDIGAFEEGSGQLIVGAGAVLADVQAAARRVSKELPLDHGARSAATAGGLLATDAGGSLAFKHGTMRRQVVGLEAALADGRLISRMSGLLKDNAGYRWQDVLAGSEGTLAVITRMRLQLQPAPAHRLAALLGFDSFADALRTMQALGTRVRSLRAADFFTAEGLALVRAHRKLPAPLPFEHPVYLVIELASDDSPLEELAAAGLDRDVETAVADDTSGRARLWEYRDAHNESVRAHGVPHKLDVSVPPVEIPAFAEDLRTTVSDIAADAKLILYGHLGDGNVHVNILGLDPADVAVDDAVLRLAVAHRGTISAEHGVGIAKTRWLSLVRSADEIELMRAMKRAFDGTGLLSPGRIFDIV